MKGMPGSVTTAASARSQPPNRTWRGPNLTQLCGISPFPRLRRWQDARTASASRMLQRNATGPPQDPPRRAKQQSPHTSICMTWNYQPECPYTDCRYKHICLHCYGMHKATYCPQRRGNPLPRGGNGRYQPYPRDIPPARREQQAGYPPRFAGNPHQRGGCRSQQNKGWCRLGKLTPWGTCKIARHKFTHYVNQNQTLKLVSFVY